MFYNLDNEPGLWGEALPADWHPGVPTVRIQPNPHGPHASGRCTRTSPTFQELRDKTIDHAAAIKSVNPDAMVFGGVGYGWNDFASLQDAPDRSTHSPVVDYDGNETSGSNKGELSFYEYLLDSVKREDDARGLTAQGKHADGRARPALVSGGAPGRTRTPTGHSRITDYSDGTAASARVQAPRSLWDPTYTEVSWISKWGVGSGPGAFGQVKLLPRVQQDINTSSRARRSRSPSTTTAARTTFLAASPRPTCWGFSAATACLRPACGAWPRSSSSPPAAFKMYLDYDGASGNGKFGDLSITANTDQISQSAVYASLDSTDPTRMVLVAINRHRPRRQDDGHRGDARSAVHRAEVYQLTSSSSTPQRQADIPIDLVNAFLYTMPASSVTTLVLHAAPEGDFNGDGFVDDADLAPWTAGLGTSAGATLGAGDYDGDHDVDGRDFLDVAARVWHDAECGGGDSRAVGGRAWLGERFLQLLGVGGAASSQASQGQSFLAALGALARGTRLTALTPVGRLRGGPCFRACGRRRPIAGGASAAAGGSRPRRATGKGRSASRRGRRGPSGPCS